MNDTQPTVSFRQLLVACPRIEIPLIQRDYAQGRESENEVRDHFLKALHDALIRAEDGAGYSLNLDFVYGSKEGGASGTFLPLDGQQRLTTLFLLHWYLGWRDGRLTDVQDMLWDGNHSRFTYCVRPSGTEFFDELVRYSPTMTPDEVPSIRSLLENQAWFFLHWRLDPTIQSSLVMLDAIHDLFGSTSGLYDRLIDDTSPAITFQLLPLEHFGLTDDLYIKMNARGKPLTPFETFKARFEELLGELFPNETRALDGTLVGVPEFFEHRMDTLWTDFFWGYKDSRSNTFDEAVMNLAVGVIRVSLNPESTNFGSDTSLLRGKRSWTFSTLHERGWLTREFAENFIVLLEAWSNGSDRGRLSSVLPDTLHFDEVGFFAKASIDPSGIDYLLLVQFAALAFYLREHEGNVAKNSISEWMRVTSNLAMNSDIERPEQFGRSLAGLRRLVVGGQKVLELLSSTEIGQVGFSPQQVQEEVLKAKLLLANPGWRARIQTAERHGYFSGQIEFMLDFCGVVERAKTEAVSDWSDETHQQLQIDFDAYARKSAIMFGNDGLADGPAAPARHLWKRALLATGDYMMQIGSNRSFLTNPAKNPDSWKRYLRDGHRRTHLKVLLDQIDADRDINTQLRSIVAAATGLEPWRSAVVNYPEVIEYCGQQETRWPYGEKEIYLLAKRQMNGAHAELFSYVLFLELAKGAKIDLAPLTLHGYHSVTTSEHEPYFLLSFAESGQLAIFAVRSEGGHFRLSVGCSGLSTLPDVEEYLRNEAHFSEVGPELSRLVSRQDIFLVVGQLAQRLRNRA